MLQLSGDWRNPFSNLGPTPGLWWDPRLWTQVSKLLPLTPKKIFCRNWKASFWSKTKEWKHIPTGKISRQIPRWSSSRSTIRIRWNLWSIHPWQRRGLINNFDIGTVFKRESFFKRRKGLWWTSSISLLIFFPHGISIFNHSLLFYQSYDPIQDPSNFW